MAEWSSLTLNGNLVKAETEKALLIACPHSTPFDGFAFWHPRSMSDTESYGWAVTIRFPENWRFRLTRKSKRTLKVLEEREVDASEFAHVLSPTAVKVAQAKAYSYRTDPEPLHPEEVEVIGDLVND